MHVLLPCRNATEYQAKRHLNAAELTKLVTAKAGVEVAELVGDLAGQRQAASDAAELARQQQVFTDQTLDNALLPQGAVATGTDRLREVVGQGLAEFLTTIDQINTSVHRVYSARELGLVDDHRSRGLLPDRGSLRPGDQRRPDRSRWRAGGDTPKAS